MKLSICIVNWEGGEIFNKCLQSITSNCQDIKLTDYEIIIVDNASKKIDTKTIEETPKVKLYINDSNLLFSKATNQSIEYSKGELILILNNDVILRKKCLRNLLLGIKRNDAVVPQLIYPNKKIQKSVTGLPSIIDVFYTSTGINHLNKKYDNWLLNHFDYTKKQVVSGQPCFSALLLKRKTWEKVGPLDENFPLLWNDTDWFLRFQKKGLKCLYNPQSKVIHIHGMSVNKNKYKKVFISTKYMYKYFKKNSVNKNKFQFLILKVICIYTFFIRIITNSFICLIENIKQIFYKTRTKG